MEKGLEYHLMNSYKVDMIAYMKAHPEDIDEAVRLAVSDRQPYAWRSAWLLWSCMEENDPRLIPHVKKIIDSLESKNDGHQRELLKILLMMELDEKQEGFLFDLCVDIWEKTGKKPSVRFTAIKMISKIVKNHPELTREIELFTQDNYMESLSSGVRRSVYRIIKGMVAEK